MRRTHIVSDGMCDSSLPADLVSAFVDAFLTGYGFAQVDARFKLISLQLALLEREREKAGMPECVEW